MKAIIAVLIVCVVRGSLGQDCSQKIQDMKKCFEDSHKQGGDDMKAKFEALKPKIDACYTDNDCTAPVKTPGKESENPQAKECMEGVHAAMKKNVEDCVKKDFPAFTFPAKDGEHEMGGHHRFSHKDENKNLDGCANKEKVRDCKKAIFAANKPSDDEKKAKFQARCDAKQKCLSSLGDDCQSQMEKMKSTFCKCGQQLKTQRDQLRQGVPACANVPARAHKEGGDAGKEGHSCDETPKDYCKLGYDAFVQDHPHKSHDEAGH